ncbi:MAG: NfeD family protein [Rubricoccaceae bacterium]|nr:NfeD family protein [Rubricoccaceae bacterium]
MARLSLLLLAVALAAGPATAQAPDGEIPRLALTTDGPVFRVPIEGMIDNALARYVDRALAEAEAAEASAVVFEIDTYGGLLDAADQIRTAILDAPMPTIAFIDRNAASAGALIAYANDRIAFVPGASMGAATAVDAAGQYASEKVQSYTRGLIRATAEATGRDGRIAEAMVDERIAIPGVVEEGQLLTLTADEALRLGVADAVVPTFGALAEAFGLAEQPVERHAASTVERVLRFLGSPIVASILMLMMMGGLYFELQTPGVGFAGGMALLGAALFFAPHYVLGLAESWEIILFVVGLSLIAVEVFVIPGFGVAGIAGIVLTIGSLLAALLPNVGFAFPSGTDVAQAAATLASSLVLLVLLAISVGRYLPRSERFSHLVLAPDFTAAEGYTSADTDDSLLGQTGRTLSPLRPAGVADIGGRRVDVVAQSTFVPPGTAVEVVSVRGSRVEVREVRTAQGEAAQA